MIPFRSHRLLVGGRHIIPLPKLNHAQVRFLAAGLERRGFVMHRQVQSFTATSHGARIHFEKPGYCWSTKDPSDAILPLIPDLLSFAKEKVPAAVLRRMYFAPFLADGAPSVLMRTRLEAAWSWVRLRASGDCGLTPDERLAAVLLAGSAQGPYTLVSDFPTDRSLPMIFGRRLYFRLKLQDAEAGLALRGVGERRTRNCYIPKDGVFKNVTPSQAAHCVSELALGAGEWCFFEPET